MRVRCPLWRDEYEREQSESERAQVRVESERLASSPLQHGDAGLATAYGCHTACALMSVSHDAHGLLVQTGH